MRFQAVVLVTSAIIFAAEWQLCTGYLARIGNVPIENGKCQYNGTEITPGEPLKIEFPCQEWRCGTEGGLVIAGCGSVDAGPGCTVVKGTGIYPDCCDQLACD